jgi:hypothetical protein
MMFGKTAKMALGLSIRSFAERPFKVLGLQQVAIGNEKKNDLTKFWGDIMGLKSQHSFKSVK